MEDFAYETARLWQLGDASKDNGLLILLVGTVEITVMVVAVEVFGGGVASSTW